jgi:hypothetical protein
MVFNVLGLANPCIWKSWLTVKMYVSAQSLINWYTVVLMDMSGLGDSYRISDHYYYIMLNTVVIIIMPC